MIFSSPYRMSQNTFNLHTLHSGAVKLWYELTWLFRHPLFVSFFPLPYSLLLWLLTLPLGIITFSFNQVQINDCLLVSGTVCSGPKLLSCWCQKSGSAQHLRGIWHPSTADYLWGHRAHYQWRQRRFTGNGGPCLQSWKSVTKYQGPQRLGAPSYYQSWQSIADEPPASEYTHKLLLLKRRSRT